MSFYLNLYNKLCSDRSQLKEKYGYKSGLHAHRILPGHSGGEYTEENVTYLTPREHVIVHFLLWKIYKNPNDLRSMNMLGAKLTLEQRIRVGKWCHENKIGFHSDPKYARQGAEAARIKQKETYEKTGDKNNFYYWSTEEGRKERASLGGLTSWGKTKKERGLPYFIPSDPEERRQKAIKAAKATPKFPVTDGIICKKFHTKEDRNQFLKENPNFKSGMRPYQRKNPKKTSPNTRFWINKEGVVKWVKPDKIDLWLQEGWKRGRG
jgi:hypothetical protein